MPEDWYVPIRDFSLHMRILDYFHKKYPQVHIALHAGELVEGLVPPEDLQFHVRDSVEIGHAERIGHGVDVMNETRPIELLHEMASNKVMVEICLTSNDVILGVRGPQHPLREYIRAGVPVALATDDEGVARSDMTHEYLKAAQEQDLSYSQLKTMARTSLEHAFIGGSSLWRDGNMAAAAPPCSGKRPGPTSPRRPARSSWMEVRKRGCSGSWRPNSSSSKHCRGSNQKGLARLLSRSHTRQVHSEPLLAVAPGLLQPEAALPQNRIDHLIGVFVAVFGVNALSEPER